MRLAIGDKTYSSWSLRAWLAARASGAAFEEELLPLDTDAFHRRIREISPAGRVPVLRDGDITVWDSLAIIEYLAEIRPQAQLWPGEASARAHARAIVAEFHSGFFDLRGNYPMNLRRRRHPIRERPTHRAISHASRRSGAIAAPASEMVAISCLVRSARRIVSMRPWSPGFSPTGCRWVRWRWPMRTR